MVLSNKAILVVLWELFPNHPNLLPAYFSPKELIEQNLGKGTNKRKRKLEK